MPFGARHMHYSAQGFEETKRLEACRFHAFQDSGGVWTIGYGHTGPDVYEGLVWTQEQCDAALRKDLGID